MTSMSTNHSSVGSSLGGSDYASTLMGSRGMGIGGSTGAGLLSPQSLPTYHRSGGGGAGPAAVDPYRSPSCSSQGSNTQASPPVNNYCSQGLYDSRQHMSIQDDVMASQNGNGTNVTSASTTSNVLNIAPQSATSYSRVNWYMPTSSDDVSAYANMFGQATSPSCQLSAAAFRNPYKNTSAYSAYDCSKY